MQIESRNIQAALPQHVPKVRVELGAEVDALRGQLGQQPRTREEAREAVRAMRAENANLPDGEIARRVGVSPSAVAALRRPQVIDHAAAVAAFLVEERHDTEEPDEPRREMRRCRPGVTPEEAPPRRSHRRPTAGGRCRRRSRLPRSG